MGIDPKVDIAFKKVFGSEEDALLLIDLLHGVIQPARPITGLDYGPGHSRKDSVLDKQAIGDVRARDQGGRQFHLEMQWLVPWFFLKRVLFYWSKFHPEQLREGEDYQTLRPTISVCFVNQVVFPNVVDHQLVFRLLERKHGLLFSDDIEIHLIELPKFTKTAEELSGALDRWCYFLRHGAELDRDHLPATLDVREIRRAMEVLTVFTQDEEERAAYERRLMYQRDQSSLLREVREAREAAEGMQAALRDKEIAERARETALRDKETAERARETADRDKEIAERARETAERDREIAERAREKTAAISQIRLCQLLLKQPQASEEELAALSSEDLAAVLAQLLQPLLPKG